MFKRKDITKESNISHLFYSLLGWCLFDFANSIAAVIGGIYFAKWFIEDVGASSILLNILFFSSALFIMLTGKWVGKNIDIHGYVFWIKLSSSIAFVGMLFLFLASQLIPLSYLIFVSFIFFMIFLFGYQVSRICHNVFLRSVIPNEIQSKMSGYGASANWAGSIIGIILTIPIITLYPNMYGRELTFLIATISYGVLTLISLFLMLSYKVNAPTSISTISKKKYNWYNIIVSTGSSLLIYFILFDVMATVEKNLPPYLTRVYNMVDDTQAFGFLLVLFSAVIGGIIAAKKINYSNSSSWLKISTLILSFAIILMTIHNNITIWSSFILAGISYGLLESAIRLNFMASFSPEEAGEHFGILAVAERTSGVIGPLFWIIPFTILRYEIQAYVVSMLLMSSMALLAFILLFFVKKPINPTSI